MRYDSSEIWDRIERVQKQSFTAITFQILGNYPKIYRQIKQTNSYDLKVQMFYYTGIPWTSWKYFFRQSTFDASNPTKRFLHFIEIYPWRKHVYKYQNGSLIQQNINALVIVSRRRLFLISDAYCFLQLSKTICSIPCLATISFTDRLPYIHHVLGWRILLGFTQSFPSLSQDLM